MPKKSAAKKLAQNAKAAARQTVKAAKNVKRSVKATAKAVKSVAKALKKTAKKTPKKITPKRNTSGVYELRKAPHTIGRTVMERLSNLENNAGKFDALKDPGERWVVKMYGHETYRTFGSAEQIKDYMTRRYDVVNTLGGKREDPSDDLALFNNIQIMRTGEGGKEHTTRRRAEKVERKQVIKETYTGLRKMFGSRDEKGKLRTTVDFAALAAKQNASLAEENERLRKAQDTLAKRLAAIEKKLSKNVPRGTQGKKKAAKKKAVVLTPAQKGWETRRKMAAEAAKKAAKRSKAAKKAAKTRKANKKGKR